MVVHYRTQGFVLKKTDLREADQLFSIYTKDFGKLEILGKAIRKIQSKLRSGVELFYLSEIEFVQGKTHKTLTDAIVIEKFRDIRQDLEKLKIASKIVEAVDNLIRGREKDENIWNLLTEVFNKLESYELRIKNYELIYYYFLWNLLSILGYQIDLYNCPICQKKLTPQKLYFNSGEGLVCSDCAKRGQEISADIIKILRLFLKNDWQTLLRLKIRDCHKKELESISESVIMDINT